VLPGMQEDAVAKVDAAMQAALNKRVAKWQQPLGWVALALLETPMD